nr:STAS domain-containing protein [uncultured Actinoplanes sp.]
MTPDILTVTTQDGPGVSTVLAVSGEIDRDSRDFLEDAAEEALRRGRPRLVLDAAGVTFCDSSGLSLLVDLHRRTTGQGGWLRLAGAPPLLRTMLRVTHLDQLFPLYDTVPEALE